MGTTEVKAKLTFDSNAEDTLHGIREELLSMRDDVRSAREGFGQFTQTLGALVVHDFLGPSVKGLKEMVTGAVELGIAADDTRQNIAGMMAGMSGKEWTTARGSAQMLRNEFNQLAIDVGQSRESIEQSHLALRTFLGGNEQAFVVADRNIKNLASIANVTGVDLREFGMQFGKMAAGFVSMESPIFNLLKTTGIFSSKISEINQEWQKLTSEERIKRLEGAVAKVATNLQAATPTVTDLMTSIKATGTEFLESFGGAFIKEVIDELASLRKTINAGGKDFQEFAKVMGKDFGKEVAHLIDDLIRAAEYFRENGGEIADDIRDAFKFAKETIKFMVDNAGLLAGIAVGAKGLSMVPGAGDAAMNFGKGAVGMAGEGLAGRAGSAIPGLISAVVAGGPPVWAAAAAVTALGGAAAYLTAQSVRESKVKQERIDELMRKERDRYKELHEMQAEEAAERKRDLQELRALAKELGVEIEAVNKFRRIGGEKRRTLDESVTPYTTQAGNYLAMEKEPTINPQLLAETRFKAVEDISEGLRAAVETGDAAISGAILDVLLKNTQLSEAFRNSADTISIGADGLKLAMKALEEAGAGGGRLYKFFEKELGGLATPNSVNVNFNGNTFKIQQDFRDQDPDRIAIAFEQRIARTAVSRVRASTSSPFGA